VTFLIHARAAFCTILMLLSCHAAYAVDRVVSLNLCTDQMLVLLAPEKVAALTPLSRDPSLSFVAPEAAHLPIVRASAEAVLALHPDLVLAASYAAQNTVELLEEEGARVLRVDLPHDFAGIRVQTRGLAAVLGVPQRADALLAAMDARLDGASHQDRTRRALAWEPRGLTAGPGSLMDAVLRAAGLLNMSEGRHIGLEALLHDPPDILVVSQTPEFPSLATALLDHPALAGLHRRAIPPALTICAGPFTAQAVALLAR
jgi:iron complex transport system substrate-binding protein